MLQCTALRTSWAPLRGQQQRCGLSVRSEAVQHVASAPAAAAATAPAGPQLRLQFGVKNIPHPSKAHYGGEDAYFVSELGGGAMGIADGVGGWHESGINPADYSKNFMATARQFLEECASVRAAAATAVTPAAAAAGEAAPAADAADADASSSAPGEPRTAVEALDVAHRATRVPGSATACVLRLDGRTGELDAANLGDSGFLIIRAGQLHFQSPAMQHFFDCPLQFGLPPDTDWAEDAAVFRFQLEAGDAIVLATDGLLDNLRPEDIVRLAPRSADQVEQAAAALAELASRNAGDPEYESPYTQEALQEGFDIPIWEKIMSAKIKDGKLELGKLRGGKMDDITVLCAYATHAPAQP